MPLPVKVAARNCQVMLREGNVFKFIPKMQSLGKTRGEHGENNAITHREQRTGQHNEYTKIHK
jgi:hypothetical protein